jgi:hypothetical protein
MGDNDQASNTKASLPLTKHAEADFQKSYTHQGVKPDGPAPTARVQTPQQAQPAASSPPSSTPTQPAASSPPGSTPPASTQSTQQPVQHSTPDKKP